MRLVRHAACALYPPTDGLPGLRDMEVDAFLRRYREEAPAHMWLGLVAGSAVFAASPVLTLRLPVPSFVLPRSLLDTHARRIGNARNYFVRQPIFLVKLAAGLCWGAHPAVRERMGMPAYPEDPGSFRPGDA